LLKPAAGKAFFPALWILAVLVVAVAALVAAAPAKSGHAGNSAPAVSPAKTQPAPPAAQARLNATLAALPLAFEANEGQLDPQVKYMARGNGYKVYLTSGDAVLSFASSSIQRVSRPRQIMEQRTLGYSRKTKQLIRRHSEQNRPASSAFASARMHVLNGNAKAKIEEQNPMPGKVNYFIGNDTRHWHVGVKEFARVSYRNIYPGVDLTYHGQHDQLEFDFIVASNANPTPIGLSFAGTRRMTTDDAGNLILSFPAGDLTLHKPVAYQQRNGVRQAVDARFVLKAKNQVGFEIGAYDRSRELVIDPSLSYATYIGGSDDDEGYGIIVDSLGNAYVTGESDSTSGFPGSPTPGGGFDAFVVQITPGGGLGYTTFVGGSGDDLGTGIAVKISTGAVYVAGITTSTDLPLATGSAQPTSGSPAGSNCTTGTGSQAPCTDAFAFKLNPAGALSYLTYLGGNNDDGAFAIALDGSGNAYVTGFTYSSDFPLSTPLFPTLNNGVASTPPFEDAFVTEVNPTGTAFVYSTYLGGQNDDFGNGIAVDGSGDAFVTGSTSSSDFHTTTGAYQTKCGTDGFCNPSAGLVFSDVFVTEFAAGGGSLLYSTYLGGSSDDEGLAIALDGTGNVFVTGQTAYDDTNDTSVTTDDFPIVGGFQPTYGPGTNPDGSNAFVSKLAPLGQGTTDLLYSSYLGGSTADTGLGIAVDSAGDAYVTGSTLSSDFPATAGFQTTLNGNSDAFVTEVAAGGASLAYSSYLGGPGDENFDSTNGAFLGGGVALSANSEVFLAGTSSATGFPVAGAPLQGTFGGAPFDAFAAIVTSTVSPDYTISASAPAAVSAGTSGTSTVTLTALNGYNSPVNLTCSVAGSGSPLPACSATSFSPASPITPTAGGATSTLTITTTGASGALFRPRSFFYAMWLPIAGLSLAGMKFSSARSLRKKLLGVLMVGVVMTALFLLPACGGGSSSTTKSGCTGCTPPGAYTVTITGAGTDTNATKHSTSVTLTVN